MWILADNSALTRKSAVWLNYRCPGAWLRAELLENLRLVTEITGCDDRTTATLSVIFHHGLNSHH